MTDSAGIRVALVLATSTGGVGQHVRSLAGALARAGHRVRVCGPAATESLFGFTSAGAAFRAVEIPAAPHPVRDLAAVARLRRVTAGADVVHAHGLRAGLVAAVARRRPLVVTWHNLLLADGWRRAVLVRLEPVVARAADVTLAASADLAGRAARLGARDVRLAPVAAPAHEEPTQDPATVREELGAVGRPLVLSVGRLHPQKGFDVLVDAAAALASGWTDGPTPLVVVAGGGPEEARLRDQIDATRAPVRLLGHRDDVADLLDACDAAVVTSVWEARQLFAQEALRAGRPLVATAVGGLPGLVGDGALLVPAGDAAAVADALRRLLTDAGAAADLAARARAVAAGWPDEAATAEAVFEVYRELVASRASAGSVG